MKILSTKSFGSDRLKILIYGDAGQGKTHLAKTIGQPTLVISVESGLRTLSDSDIPYVDITTNDKGELIPREMRIERLKQVYEYLQTDEARKAYKYIFIDSLSEISDNLVEKYQKKYPEKRDALSLWGDMKKEMVGLIRAFRDLPNYSVIMTALQSRDKDENGQFYIGPALTPSSLAEDLPKFFDYVWQLSVREEDKQKRRKIVTQPTDTVRAKSRITPEVKLKPIEDAEGGLAPILAKL